MIIKDTVKVFGMRQEILLAVMVAASVFKEQGIEFVITSIRDGKHSQHSKHYIGAAVDIRMNHLQPHENPDFITDLLSRRLSREYDVVLESKGTPNQHIHIEYDPTMHDVIMTI